jgi:hypothetical protein
LRRFEHLEIGLEQTFTLLVTLAWTFGITVIVYQPGPGQRAFGAISPGILSSSGIYWSAHRKQLFQTRF